MIAASVAPLLAGQLDEQSVNEIVEERLSRLSRNGGRGARS